MNVKELRKKSGLTQDELAEKTGIPRGRIAKWEQGKGNPKSADEKKLENIFGKNLQELLPKNGVGGLNKPQGSHETQKQGLDLIKEVNRIREQQLTIEATISVILSELVHLIAKDSGRSHASVSSQLKKDVLTEIENLRSLDKKLSGG